MHYELVTQCDARNEVFREPSVGLDSGDDRGLYRLTLADRGALPGLSSHRPPFPQAETTERQKARALWRHWPLTSEVRGERGEESARRWPHLDPSRPGYSRGVRGREVRVKTLWFTGSNGQGWTYFFMPQSCSVPRCKGNYKNGSKVRVFSFPKDEESTERESEQSRGTNLSPIRTAEKELFGEIFFFQARHE